MRTPIRPGHISREALVECGEPGCCAHDYAREPRSAARFRKLGWVHVRAKGWLCPDHAPKQETTDGYY